MNRDLLEALRSWAEATRLAVAHQRYSRPDSTDVRPDAALLDVLDRQFGYLFVILDAECRFGRSVSDQLEQHLVDHHGYSR